MEVMLFEILTAVLSICILLVVAALLVVTLRRNSQQERRARCCPMCALRQDKDEQCGQ